MMKLAVVGFLALAGALVEARHHVSQNAFGEFYFDCIGCFQKNNWYCAR